MHEVDGALAAVCTTKARPAGAQKVVEKIAPPPEAPLVIATVTDPEPPASSMVT